MFRVLLSIGLLLFQLVFCSSNLRADSGDYHDIYAAYALTGVGASFGDMEVKGTELAIKEFNKADTVDGKKVRLVVEDTHSSNVHSLSAVNKLISLNHAQIILGPTWLDSFQSVLPVAEKKQVMLFAPSCALVVVKNNSKQYPLVFSTWYDLETEVKLLLQHLKTESRKRIALGFDQDYFFQTIRKLILDQAPKMGIQIVSDDSVDMRAGDFKTILAKVKRAEADGAVFGFADEANLFGYLKARREIFPDLRLYGTDYLDGYVSQAEWIDLFDKVDFIAPLVKNSTFIARFKAEYGIEPVLSASTAYDATSILLEGLRQGARSPEQLKTFLHSKSFQTVTFGNVKFGSLGGVDTSFFEVKKVRSGNVESAPIS